MSYVKFRSHARADTVPTRYWPYKRKVIVYDGPEGTTTIDINNFKKAYKIWKEKQKNK